MESLVQQRVELCPDFILLCVSHMAIRTLLFRPQFGGWRLGLMVVEVVVAPSSRVGIALRIFDCDVCTVQRPREIATPGGFCPGAVSVLCRQRELQFLEQDRSFGKFIGSFV